MEHDRFDNFARAISGTSTRRRFSALLLGLGVGSTAGLSLLGGDAEAKNKNKAKRRRARKRKHKEQQEQPQPEQPAQPQQPTCVPNCAGKECGPDGCGSVCGQCPFLLPVCDSVTQTCKPII